MPEVTTDGLVDDTAEATSIAAAQWAIAAGSADVITAAYPEPSAALTDGLVLGFRASAANATNAPTFAPDGLTAHPITRKGGSVLAAGNIPAAGAEVLVRYNLANTRWELLNPYLTTASAHTYSAAGGSSDAITGTYSPVRLALEDGLLLKVRASAANTTTTPTFSPDGLTARTIVRGDGTTLRIGDIASGLELLLEYDLANTRWKLLNPLSATTPASSTFAIAGGAADAITATFSPAWTSISDGQLLKIRATATNILSTTTFAPDGLTARTIVLGDGSTIRPGDIVSGSDLLLEYDLANTRWKLLNPANTPMYIKALVADDTGGTNVNTAQPWFPTAGAVTLPVGTYEFEGLLYLSRAAGSTNHTTSLLFGGTATIGAISYDAIAMTGDANTLVSESGVHSFAATAVVVKAASTSTTEQASFQVRGILTVTVTGTLIPQFQYSAAPGGAPTVKAGSHFLLRKLPANSVGAWA